MLNESPKFFEISSIFKKFREKFRVNFGNFGETGAENRIFRKSRELAGVNRKFSEKRVFPPSELAGVHFLARKTRKNAVF